jgi:cytochrome c oxidase subunit 2
VVTVCTAFVLYKFRHKEGEQFEPKTLSKKWEIPMLGVPLALVVVFFLMTLKTMYDVHPSAEGKNPDVVITGHQFWWEANYPAEKVTAANEIHLPAGRTILLKLLTADVIHDWWVPSFGNKMDLVSGKENYLWLNIKEPGVYHGTCSEFCGAQHANMHIIVIAQNQQDYAQWLQQNTSKSAAINNALVLTGAQIFQQKTCGNCHNVSGTPANGGSGPDLTHLASRQTLLTGVLKNNQENLKRWIQNPQEIKPGAKMPKFVLDKQSLEALTTYLTSLK